MSHHIICELATKEQLIILQITQRVNITPNMVREKQYLLDTSDLLGPVFPFLHLLP
jgi:hypothetical protein